jgi:hypothetical protein
MGRGYLTVWQVGRAAAPGPRQLAWGVGLANLLEEFPDAGTAAPDTRFATSIAI